jgi:ankyrin repeat protein
MSGMTKLLPWLAPALIAGLLLDPGTMRAKEPFCPELTEAAYDGDLGKVKELLASGVNIESTDGSSTALIRAASNGKTEVVRYLIGQGARLEAEMGSCTPLAFAIENNHFETARLLVTKGARLDATGDYDHSPLHYAIESKRFEVAKWLLRQGANPSLQNWRRNTPLMEAVDNPDLVRFLIRMGADVNIKQGQGHTALSDAISAKRLESVRLLLAHGARQHHCRWDESAVMVAVQDGTPEILRLLLQYNPWLEARTNGPDRSTPGQTALEIALEKGNDEAVRILRRHGAREVPSPGSRGS